MQIEKTAGPDKDGIPRGHCYDGTGWFICEYWSYSGTVNHCTLFGVDADEPKDASKALEICDSTYGVHYSGQPRMEVQGDG